MLAVSSSGMQWGMQKSHFGPLGQNPQTPLKSLGGKSTAALHPLVQLPVTNMPLLAAQPVWDFLLQNIDNLKRINAASLIQARVSLFVSAGIGMQQCVMHELHC